MDVILLGFIGGYVVGGWRTGFLRRLVGLGFVAASFVAGAYLRQPVGKLIAGIFSQVPEQYADMVGYAVSFTALVIILNVIAHPILGRVAVGGLSKAADRGLGAVFGAIEAVVLLSAAIVILDTYFGPGIKPPFEGLGFLSTLSAQIDASSVGQSPDQYDGPVHHDDPRAAAAQGRDRSRPEHPGPARVRVSSPIQRAMTDDERCGVTWPTSGS